MGLPGAVPSRPDASDMDLMWEAFLVAAFNGREAVLDALLGHGFDINYEPFGEGFSILAASLMGNDTETAELLVPRGARPSTEVRESIESWYEQRIGDRKLRRLVELLGGNPNEVEERVARTHAAAAALTPRFLAQLDLARQDAARVGSAMVEPENVFVGMLHAENALPLGLLAQGNVDLPRLHKMLALRLVPGPDPVPPVPLSDATQRALDRAKSAAEERRREHVHALFLLWAVLGAEPVRAMIRNAGGDPDLVRSRCEASL
jgi:hypothetical protein